MWICFRDNIYLSYTFNDVSYIIKSKATKPQFIGILVSFFPSLINNQIKEQMKVET